MSHLHRYLWTVVLLIVTFPLLTRADKTEPTCPSFPEDGEGVIPEPNNAQVVDFAVSLNTIHRKVDHINAMNQGEIHEADPQNLKKMVTQLQRIRQRVRALDTVVQGSSLVLMPSPGSIKLHKDLVDGLNGVATGIADFVSSTEVESILENSVGVGVTFLQEGSGIAKRLKEGAKDGNWFLVFSGIFDGIRILSPLASLAGTEGMLVGVVLGYMSSVLSKLFLSLSGEVPTKTPTYEQRMTPLMQAFVNQEIQAIASGEFKKMNANILVLRKFADRVLSASAVALTKKNGSAEDIIQCSRYKLSPFARNMAGTVDYLSDGIVARERLWYAITSGVTPKGTEAKFLYVYVVLGMARLEELALLTSVYALLGAPDLSDAASQLGKELFATDNERLGMVLHQDRDSNGLYLRVHRSYHELKQSQRKLIESFGYLVSEGVLPKRSLLVRIKLVDKNRYLSCKATDTKVEVQAEKPSSMREFYSSPRFLFHLFPEQVDGKTLYHIYSVGTGRYLDSDDDEVWAKRKDPPKKLWQFYKSKLCQESRRRCVHRKSIQKDHIKLTKFSDAHRVQYIEDTSKVHSCN